MWIWNYNLSNESGTWDVEPITTTTGKVTQGCPLTRRPEGMGIQAMCTSSSTCIHSFLFFKIFCPCHLFLFLSSIPFYLFYFKGRWSTDFSLILKGFLNIIGDCFPFLNRTQAATCVSFCCMPFSSICQVDCYNTLIESC